MVVLVCNFLRVFIFRISRADAGRGGSFSVKGNKF